jgi:hypothetical protein
MINTRLVRKQLPTPAPITGKSSGACIVHARAGTCGKPTVTEDALAQ